MLPVGFPAGSIVFLVRRLTGGQALMKFHRILCLSVTLIIPQLAPAKVPLPDKSLGQIESILDFCGQIDPQSAAKIKDVKKMLVGDASEKELAEVRDKQEYKDSYQSVSDQLAKVAKSKASKACSAYLEGGK
jgi:hypothetical protein